MAVRVPLLYRHCLALSEQSLCLFYNYFFFSFFLAGILAHWPANYSWDSKRLEEEEEGGGGGTVRCGSASE